METWFLRILLSASLAVVVALGWRIVGLSLDASALFRDYYSGLAVGEKVLDASGYLIEGFSLGLLPAGSERDDVAAALLDGATTLGVAANTYAVWFVGAALGFLAIAWLASLWPADSRRWVRCMALIAMVCMAVGQVAPVMELTSTSDAPVVGEIVLQHESKSILSAASVLWSTGKEWVALLIVLFSLVVPAGKLLTCLVAARSVSGRVTEVALRVVGVLGRWSMADVFVVASLLAIFSLRADRSEVGARHQSEPGIGLFFFAAHCILAMVVSHLLARKRSDSMFPDGRPSSLKQILGQVVTFGIALVCALCLLRPAVRADHDVVVASGMRWACSVVVHGDGGTLRCQWRSSGAQHGGADETMVAVHLVGPDGRFLKTYDHESSGAFEVRSLRRGVYTMVFSNAGMIRSTSRGVRVRMAADSGLLQMW
jgi:paraquat-inducible protein A